MPDLTLQSFQNLVPLDKEASGRGVLYTARYNGLDVFLKVMPVASETARQAFEVLSARTDQIIALNHPGIVRHIGCFQHKGSRGLQHVVVTERLQGETLNECLAREAAGIGTIESLRMAQACLATLRDLAAVSLLHRDLTPSNIFIVSGGAHPEYKLIDFGVERFDPPSPEDATSTMPVPEKQDYVAPELFGGDQPPTERSDLYTFTMTLHEALTGKLAFKRSSFKQEGIGEPLSCVNWLVMGLGILLEDCFKQDPEERLATFEALHAEMSGLQPTVLEGTAKRSYRLLHFVGEGGFGRVFKAEEMNAGAREGTPDALVAVKHLTKTDCANRFEREAKTLQQFSDSRIVQFVDYFRQRQGHSDDRFLVMRYLPGMPGASLHERLKAARVDRVRMGLPVGEVCEAFIRYTEGLAILHAKGVYHRDIKPANLYLPEACPEEACIMDLGIVRNVNATETQGNMPGSPDYMPPEFVSAEGGRGSPGSDLYALGLCLFEALTGRYLYGHHSKREEAWRNYFDREKLRPEPKITPLEKVAPEFVDVVRRMTFYENDKRATSDEVVRLLCELAAQIPQKKAAAAAAHGKVQISEEQEAAPTLATVAADDLRTQATVAEEFTEATVAAEEHTEATVAAADTLATVAAEEPLTAATVAMPEPEAPVPVPAPKEAKPPKPPKQPRAPMSPARRAAFKRVLKVAAVLVVLVGMSYAAVRTLPVAVARVSTWNKGKSYNRAMTALDSDITKMGRRIEGATAAADFSALTEPLHQMAFVGFEGRLAVFAADTRNPTWETSLSNNLVRVVETYSNAVARLSGGVVDKAVAAWQGEEAARGARLAEERKAWSPLLTPVADAEQAAKIAAAQRAYEAQAAAHESQVAAAKRAKELEEERKAQEEKLAAEEAERKAQAEKIAAAAQAAKDEEERKMLAAKAEEERKAQEERRLAAEKVREEQRLAAEKALDEAWQSVGVVYAAAEVKMDETFKVEYEADGTWVGVTDNLKRPPGAVRFRFTRADYEPVPLEAVVEPRKPLTITVPAEWTRTPSHQRLEDLRKVYARASKDGKSEDWLEAQKLVAGDAPALVRAALRTEWKTTKDKVDYYFEMRAAAEAKRLAMQEFVKKLERLAADVSLLPDERLDLPEKDILDRAEVKAAANGLIAAVTNHVITAARVDEPLDTRANRLVALGKLLRNRTLEKVAEVMPVSSKAAIDAAQAALDAAVKAVFVRVRNQTDWELQLKDGAKVAKGQDWFRKYDAAPSGRMQFEASCGDDYQPATKPVEQKSLGMHEVVFTKADFVLKPGTVTLATGGLADVSVELRDKDGKLLASKPDSVKLPAGDYTVLFMCPDCEEQKQTVTVGPGKTVAVAPGPWKRETGELVLGLLAGGNAPDITAKLTAADGRVTELKAGKHTLDTGRYTLTFSRANAADQTEAITIAARRAVERSAPTKWEPHPDSVAAVRAWAFESVRADIQKTQPPMRPENLPDWVWDAHKDEALKKAAEALQKLKGVYAVFYDFRKTATPMPENVIANFAQLLREEKYPPNRNDLTMLEAILADLEKHDVSIQSSATIDVKMKEKSRQNVSTVRELLGWVSDKLASGTPNKGTQGAKE